jgi:hypothetical protein
MWATIVMATSNGTTQKAPTAWHAAASTFSLRGDSLGWIASSRDWTKYIPPERSVGSPLGFLDGVFITVVYVERPPRKRIISAFESDEADIIDYMNIYAIEE